MRLLWSSRSPFARKALVVIHELGLAERVTLDRVLVAANTTNAEVMQVNPLSQIPTLILDDGSALFDSPVIVEYLDSQFGSGALVPAEPSRRWPVLRLQALGDGLMALNLQRMGERNRGELASQPHADAFLAKTRRTLDALEAQVADLEPFSAGSIAVAVALAHLDFRFADDAWRQGRPALTAWHATMAIRPSMTASEPVEIY
ncbi:glutathione S-transferase family protein [Acidisphaera sp. L21]|uniref:glutathione S-transferase family protein n=1 Tax=Acidisphaera sp. L21 TaxID=1641851 RepID=UPI00131EBF65|nr:glutathione S-transferase N-terminal domain-containing protein [Acidisphaera sp. L21]